MSALDEFETKLGNTNALPAPNLYMIILILLLFNLNHFYICHIRSEHTKDISPLDHATMFHLHGTWHLFNVKIVIIHVHI